MSSRYRIRFDRARQQQAAIAYTGIHLLFESAYRYGLEKRRTIVKLVGGGEIAASVDAAFRTGQRNALAAKQVLWRNGMLVNAEDTGGNTARTVHLSVQDGRV